MKPGTLMIISVVLASSALHAQVPQVSSGRIIRIENYPSQYNAPRNVDIWLPEGYHPDQKYPVLYMHDGQMLFDSTNTWNQQEWGVDEVAGKLIQEGKVRPFIVVGIHNSGAGRHADYFPQKPFQALPEQYRDSLLTQATRIEGTVLFSGEVRSDNYLKFIVEELKPYIDENYPTLRAAEGTFTAGSSMGGLISWYAICEYPEVFGGAACLSTHWPGIFTVENNPIPKAFLDYLEVHLPSPAGHRIYFDYGTRTLDSLYEPFQMQADEIMKKKGYSKKNWMTRKFEGADHSENAWRDRLEVPLVFLLD
jgi:enterochelin esterase-like enzyme